MVSIYDIEMGLYYLQPQTMLALVVSELNAIDRFELASGILRMCQSSHCSSSCTQMYSKSLTSRKCNQKKN